MVKEEKWYGILLEMFAYIQTSDTLVFLSFLILFEFLSKLLLYIQTDWLHGFIIIMMSMDGYKSKQKWNSGNKDIHQKMDKKREQTMQTIAIKYVIYR